MGTPFSFDGTLMAPEGMEMRGEPIAFSTQGQFDSRVNYVLDLPHGAGAQEIDFGTIPDAGAKMLVVKYDHRVAAMPIRLMLNNSAEHIEVASGGFLVYVNPIPNAGITSLSLSHTTAGRVRIWIVC